MFKKGDKIGIVVLSNGIDKNKKEQVKQLIVEIKNLGLVPIIGEYIYSEENHCLLIAQKKAKVLMNFYKNKDIKAIFDISGGNLANEILPFIDFEIIKNNYKPFFGYSDLTTVINAIYSNTKNLYYLYQIKNIILDNKVGMSVLDLRLKVLSICLFMSLHIVSNSAQIIINNFKNSREKVSSLFIDPKDV